MPYIICEWKKMGAYTSKDSVNGKEYKFRATAESRLRLKNLTYQYVVRKV